MEKVGPGLWVTLHGLAEDCHDDPKLYRRMLIAVLRKIPCSNCTRDSLNYLSNNNIVLPVIWICNFHNYINKKLNKEICECRDEGLLFEGFSMVELGPGMWLGLHGLAEECHQEPTLYQRIVIAVFRKIPCFECSKDSFNYLTVNRIKDPILWICRFHNYVNEKKGKKQFPCRKLPTIKLNFKNSEV